MRGKVNLLVNCPSPKDVTSIYRGMGPLGELDRTMEKLNLVFSAEYSWTTFAMSDIFFMQRPYTQAHLDMVMMSKDNGVPVWVDYDDDLFTVPASNPAHKVYASEMTQRCVANIVSHANVVTVSTPYLKSQLERGPKPLNKDIRVIPNALNTRLFHYRTDPPKERKRVITWRGSTTHHKDLATHMEAIVAAVNGDKTYTWLFQGDKPWFLFERLGDNAIFAESMDPILYFKTMHEMKAPVMIVPLHDSPFNRSKSNIAWLEAAFFGGMTIGPDWEEWRRPGCINYRDEKDFPYVLRDVMRGQYDPTAEAQKAWEYVMENLTLHRINELRRQVIEDLLD